MKFTHIYKKLLAPFFYPNISDEITKELKGPIILHISDTPEDVYKRIFKVINILRPQYIIHTGDMADNIKLENNRKLIYSYQKNMVKLIGGLEATEYSKVYYVLGNHDDYETVSRLSRKGTILEDGILTIDDCTLFVSHYHKENTFNADFNLFGHSFEPGHYKKDETRGLNGLLNINIIDLSSKKVFHLEYPVGTNRQRCMESRKIGL